MSRAFYMMVLLAIPACATPRGGTSDQAPSTVTVAASPRIDRIEPNSVSVGRGAVVEVLIVGRGFAPGTPGANTVDFANMPLNSVPANATGTEIRFAIPYSIRISAEAPPMPIHPGAYDVRVRTDHGTSNTMSITVLP